MTKSSPDADRQQRDLATVREDKISRDEALRLLGVKKETLYTYVSRGWIQSFQLNEGRTRVFSRQDVERQRARSLARAGVGARAEMVMRYGEPIITSRITEITSDGPRYRGRLAVDLAERGCSFETVALWLWTNSWVGEQIRWGDVPEFAPSISFKQRDEFVKFLAHAVLSLGLLSQEDEISNRAETLDAARRIIQVLSGTLGFLSPKSRYIPIKPGELIATSILQALGTPAHPQHTAALNAMLVLCADYELTPACFAARIVASTGGDLYASVAAGLCAHSGHLTGQVCDKLTYLLSGGARGANLKARLKEIQKFGATKYGFNSALATTGDARAYWMIQRAKELNQEISSPVTRNIVSFLDRIGEDFALYPGLAAGLVTLASALELPPHSVAAIWGIARTAGQIAHVMEQREAGFVLRPRAMFVQS